MYAIGRIADAIVVPPIPSPRTRPAVGNEEEQDSGRRTAARRWSWRTIGHAVTESWTSFVPRMRNYPR